VGCCATDDLWPQPPPAAARQIKRGRSKKLFCRVRTQCITPFTHILREHFAMQEAELERFLPHVMSCPGDRTTAASVPCLWSTRIDHRYVLHHTVLIIHRNSHDSSGEYFDLCSPAESTLFILGRSHMGDPPSCNKAGRLDPIPWFGGGGSDRRHRGDRSRLRLTKRGISIGVEPDHTHLCILQCVCVCLIYLFLLYTTVVASR
jgi:hypothetical protein